VSHEVKNPPASAPKGPPPPARSLAHDPLLAKLSLTQTSAEAFYESLVRRLTNKIGAVSGVIWLRPDQPDAKLDFKGAFSKAPEGARIGKPMLENARYALNANQRLFIYPRKEKAPEASKNPNDTPYAWVFEIINSPCGTSGVALFIFDPKLSASEMRRRLAAAGDIGFYIDTHETSRVGRQTKVNNQHLARCLAFCQGLMGNLDEKELVVQLANDLRDMAACERVSLFEWKRGKAVLKAISGVVEIERASLTSSALETAATALLEEKGEAFAALPPAEPDPALENLSTRSSAKSLLALAAEGQDGRRQFVVLFESAAPGGFLSGEGEARKETPATATARWAWQQGARALAASHQYHSLPLVGLLSRLRTVREDLSTGRRKKRYGFLVALPLIFLAIGLFPWREKSVGDCVLLPSQRGVVVSENTGRVAEVLVREGTVVKKDQVVAKLDTMELETQLQVTRQERLKLEAQARLSQAEGDLGAYQVSYLQLQRAIEQENKLRHDLSQCFLRSPMDGIILTKDVELRRGGVLQIGEPLCEVAALNDWDLQVSVPEADYWLLRKTLDEGKAAPVEFLLYARSGLKMKGELASVADISQMTYTDKEENVFYATVHGIQLPQEFQDDVRPGFSGKARVMLGRSPLAAVLTRKFIHFLRTHWVI
jgi:multidrug resistance efflux pump